MRLDVDVVVERDGFTVAAAFTATAGETCALLGPNGAGKSTLVAAIAGLVRPARGRIAWSARVLDDTAHDRHVPPEERGVGVLFQDHRLFPHLSTQGNVRFPLDARGVPAREARERARDMLQRLAVADRADAYPEALSGGEAQRVALARALVGAPEIVLLDEPFAALDVAMRPRVRAVLRDVLAASGGVRILVTHDPVDAWLLADRAIVLEAGQVTHAGTLEQLRRAPRSSYVARLVGVNLFEGRIVGGRLELHAGALEIAAAHAPAGSVVGIVRPADIALHRHHPGESSACNEIPGRVREIHGDGERVRVELESTPPLVAEITAASARRLALTVGVEVWATFKAVAVEIQDAT